MEHLDSIAQFLSNIDLPFVHFVVFGGGIEELVQSEIFTSRSSVDVTFTHYFGAVSENGAHIHWLHFCPNSGTGCHCDVRRRIRRRGYSIKSTSTPVLSEQHARNLIVYLYSGYGFRQFHKISGPRTEGLGEKFSAFNDFIDTESGRIAIEALVGPFSGISQETCHWDGAGTVNSSSSNGDLQEYNGQDQEWYIRGRKRNFESLRREEACQKTEKLLLDSWYVSLIEMETDDRYRTIWADFYNQENKIRIDLTNNIFSNLHSRIYKLNFQDIIILRKDAFTSPKYYPIDFSINIILRLLLCQFRNASDVITFIHTVRLIIDKIPPKKNTLMIRGPAGCGKSYLVNSFIDLIWSVGKCEGHITKHTGFPFENIIGKRLALFNELSIAPGYADNLKELFEGSPTNLNIKHQARVNIPRIPCIVTTNNYMFGNLNSVDREAFLQRIFLYEFKAQPWLKNLSLYPNPMKWASLLYMTEADLVNIPTIPELCTSVTNETLHIPLMPKDDFFNKL